MNSASQVYIGLCNPKSPSNVGAVLRAVGCYQADEVRYTGERFDRALKFQTDTKNAKSRIPLVQTDQLLADLPRAIQVVCVELVLGAKSLPDFQHPESAIYIFGPEDGSIKQSLIDQADHVVYVPTQGCMNLAASVNVVLYDRLAKQCHEHDNHTIIKRSRDVNNRLMVKTKSGR